MESDNNEQSSDEEEEEGRSTGYRKEKGRLQFFTQYDYEKFLAFEPYGLLVPPCNEVEYLFEEKVGLTPLSWAATGVSDCGHDKVKGGANTPFVLRSYRDEENYIKKTKDFDEYKALFKGTGLSEDTLNWLAKNVTEYSLFFFSYFS